jgi:predicted signal transduction protein with EAL and GGDEF domain
VIDRRTVSTDTAVAAAFVLGIEARQGQLTIADYQVAVQRLERAVRPWDAVVALAPKTVGVLCSALSSPREVDAVAARLAEVVRAPMAVGDEVHQVGVCVGSAVVAAGEEPKEAFTRARDAMLHMKRARSALVEPDLPAQRQGTTVVLPH